MSLLAASALAVPTVALTSPAVAHPGHGGHGAGSDAEAAADPFSVLVFSKTAGFRHDSIPAGITALEELGAENDFTVDATEDGADFTTENLANYDAVVWLSTTGDVLTEPQQQAFRQYVETGGGYAGIHAASDTEYDWPWYGDLVGAYFDSHPPGTPDATVQVTDHQHESTSHLPGRWKRTDEWYNYRENPRGDVHVLATLDEGTYEGGGMGADHPIAWCQDMEQGRSWYTGGGHTSESYADPRFRQHLLGGLQTAAGVVEADCSATVDASFEQVTLAQGEGRTGEPIAMAVLPNGDVLHTSRNGVVRRTTGNGVTTQAGRIPVYTHDEDGLQGVAIDPEFESNRWVYLYYAPPLDTPAGDAPENGRPAVFEPYEGYNQLSRYKLSAKGTLRLGTEQQIMRVPADRGICCHAGGEIDFDADGNLYLSTGDDSNPFASDGYTPIDDRQRRSPAFDARRTAGNTNDLRGKLLRISVNADGSYEVPEGNLFPEADDSNDLTRPEIYAMGLRNPFRFSVDRETGWVHMGEYGPDAGEANPNRGPGGTVEFNLIKEPGNYGWPLCVGKNKPFNDYDFATGESGAKFDCANPVNDSRYNTGLTNLPPAKGAWLPYDGDSVPELGDGGESPMGAVVYDYDADLESDTKWPEYYDGKALMYEWDRGWIKEADISPKGRLNSISPTLDWMDLRRPMNIEFGPDGSLYVLDYGGGYFGGDPLSAVYRIDYVDDMPRPRAVIEASPTTGATPLDVSFDASGSSHPDDLDLTYAWDFDGDGENDATGVTADYTYTEPGEYSARLTVTDSEGREGFTSEIIAVGNTAPQVKLIAPANGSFFEFGDSVDFEVRVTDAEDESINCDNVTVEYILGHDNHGHPLSSATGCEGTIETPADEGHGLNANIFGVINATYTDTGAEGVPSLTGDDEVKLHTPLKQAEFADRLDGVEVVEGETTGLGGFQAGDAFGYAPMNVADVRAVRARYSGGGGRLEIRLGGPEGRLAGTIRLPATEGTTLSAPAQLTGSKGRRGPVWFVARGQGADLFEVDALRFVPKPPAPAVQATTTTAKAPARSTVGSRPTVTVRVKGSGAGVPQGRVQVFKNKRRLGGAVLGEKGFARVKFGGLAVGRHTLSVRYLGQKGVSKASRTTVKHRVVRG